MDPNAITKQTMVLRLLRGPCRQTRRFPIPHPAPQSQSRNPHLGQTSLGLVNTMTKISNGLPCHGKSAIIYGRVSTDEQTSSTQEHFCRGYLTLKGLTLDSDFYDDDVSGAVAIWDRPNGRKLRERLAEGDVKHLVVAKLDRLGRKAIDLLNTVQLLDKLGIVLHIVDFGGDSLSTQGAAGRLMFTVLAGMAEFERELIRDRISKRLAVKRDKNELCGTEPYGWTAVPTGEVINRPGKKPVIIKRLEPNPEEQKWILFMRDLRAQGFGYHSVAKRLNALGVPTKRRGEILTLRTPTGTEKRFAIGKWQPGNVSKVLNNKTTQDWLASLPAPSAA
ncbi:MAG: hypothetical protein C5B50_01035 [Verrucomicrobia bacterium]|nr:MAG: hypothetical protein C5B50_01035 [Verrucomicrobiota bacterium]